MIRSAIFFLAILACSLPALARTSVPTRGAVKGDIIHINELFHVQSANFRITAIHWIPATDPKAATIAGVLHVDETSAPNGYLMFVAPQKNTRSHPDSAEWLKITAFYKDGTQVDDAEGVPVSTTYKQLLYNTNFYPGQGVMTYFFIANAPQPTVQNPLTKIIVSDPSLQNDPGYPKVYRMLGPIVSP